MPMFALFVVNKARLNRWARPHPIKINKQRWKKNSISLGFKLFTRIYAYLPPIELLTRFIKLIVFFFFLLTCITIFVNYCIHK